MARIAVVGAGIAGLVVAKELYQKKHDITIFDKGKSVGGRISNRRVTINQEEYIFEHGLSLLNRDFAHYELIKQYIDQNQLKTFEGKSVQITDDCFIPQNGEFLCSTSRITDLPKSFMDQHFHFNSQICIHQIQFKEDKWLLSSLAEMQTERDRHLVEDLTFGPFDILILAIPPKQLAPLVFDQHPEYAKLALSAKANSMWVNLCVFDESLQLPFDHYTFPKNSPFRALIKENAKPNRNYTKEAWTIQMGFQWSAQNLEKSNEEILPLILDELSAFCSAQGGQMQKTLFSEAHRWRYAHFEPNDSYPTYIFDPKDNMGICGDFLTGSHIIDVIFGSIMLSQEIGRNG